MLKIKKFIMMFIIFLIIGCWKADEKVIPYDIIDIKEIESSYNSPWIYYAKGEKIYSFNIIKPIIVLNISSGITREIGKLGFGPDRYKIPSWITEYYGNIYVGDKTTGRLLIFDTLGNFIKDAGIHSIREKFVFCNETLLIIKNPTLIDNYFILYDLKNDKQIISFGNVIEYPIKKHRLKLTNEGKWQPYYTEWDAMDSILVQYDYYNDKFIVYNIYNGKVIKRFGKKHNGWSVPRVIFFEGDKYHEKRFVVAMTPCRSLVITNNYIYFIVMKLWKYKWFSRGFYSKHKEKKIFSSNFLLVDVYSRNYEYVGSFYPLNIHQFRGDEVLRLDFVSAENDTILNFYLQSNDGTFFKRVSVKVKL